MERACAGTKTVNVTSDTGAYWVTPLLLVCKVIHVAAVIFVACNASLGVVHRSLLARQSSATRRAKQ